MGKYNKEDFESVRFRANGFIKYGRCVGNYLCVSYANQGHYDNYKIYIISTGKALTGKIADFDLAVDLCKSFAWIYRDQIFLLGYDDWCDRNIPELAQWTISDGHIWSKFWNSLKETTDQITLESLKRTYQIAKKG